MTAITELGYMGLGVKNLEDWKRFAAEILGLEVVDGDVPGQCFLRMDDWHHRLTLDEDETDDKSIECHEWADDTEFACCFCAGAVVFAVFEVETVHDV